MAYRLLRGFARFVLGLFYRRVDVMGIERLPATGPVIVAANHQNALIDPMLLLAAVPRRLRPIAKAPLFGHPLIGPFLRLAGAIPVHRRQDPGSDPTRNEAMFRTAAATLASGGTVLIFPEGVSQAEPTLMPLHTGAARMVLGAERGAGGRLGVALVPVGLVYHEPGTFRTGWALAMAGPPVRTDDCIALYRESPEPAVRLLTDRLAHALRALIVEARDRKILRLLEVAEAAWREESDPARRDPATRAAWMQTALRAYRYLSDRDPARMEHVMREVERYAKDLELAGISDRQLSRSYAPATVRRYALREGSSLLAGGPLALWGLASHLVPYRLTAAAVRLLRPSADAEATYKIGAAVLLYPLAWVLEGWVARRVGGGWLLALFVALLVPTGFFALTWWERLQRLSREARAFVRFLVSRDLHRYLLARRRSLMEELTSLARLVPDSVLAGQSREGSERSPD